MNKAIQQSELKRLRELLGYTQEMLADKLNTSTRTVQNWEKGGKIPSASMKGLLALAEKFPDEGFEFFVALNSPGAGKGNKVKNEVSKDLDKILAEMKSQRKDFMSQLATKDKQIASLIEAQNNFLKMLADKK